MEAEGFLKLIKVADQLALNAYGSNNKSRHQLTTENAFSEADTNHPDIDTRKIKDCKGFETPTIDFGSEFVESD